METPRICYYANQSFYNRQQRGYFVAKITEGEAGYIETFGLQPTAAEAEQKADQLNELLGITRDEVLTIVASSMSQGPVRERLPKISEMQRNPTVPDL